MEVHYSIAGLPFKVIKIKYVLKLSDLAKHLLMFAALHLGLTMFLAECLA